MLDTMCSYHTLNETEQDLSLSLFNPLKLTKWIMFGN